MVAVLPPAAPHFWLSPLHYRSGMNVLSDIHRNVGQPALSASRLGPPCALTVNKPLSRATKALEGCELVSKGKRGVAELVIPRFLASYLLFALIK